MYGLYFIKMTSYLCLIFCVNGQALYENNCINKAIQEMQQYYDGRCLMLTQLNNLKDQLDILRDTVDFLQFQLRCLHEKGIYEEQSVTKNQYCIMKSPSTWIDGKANCQSLGGYPLEIETQSEQIWFNGKISSSVGKWWIGLVLDTVENVWVWDHSGNASTFTNWYPTEPTGNENCVLVENDGMWRDYPCNDVFNIICERK